MVYSTLVLSGGSIKGVGFLGALQYINEISSLLHIKQYYGTSVGSIICVLLAIGIMPNELFMHFNGFNFTFSINVTQTNMEIVNYQKFLEAIKHIIETHIGYLPTLKQLDTVLNKKLFIVTYNYTRKRGELLSSHTHPDMSCLDAIKLSCAIPCVFSKTIYNNNLYFDGGLICNFPLNIAIKNKADNIIAINLFSACPRDVNDSYWTILFNVMFAPIEHKTHEIIEKYGSKCTLIQLHMSVPFTQFRMNFIQALECYLYGYITAKQALRIAGTKSS